jgi:NADP-dependent 3-hydroxy acid dehydrogenase YdfG
MNKIALITGATSGIGKATALLLAKNKFDIIITGRRKEKLEELKLTIENESDSKVVTLSFDIRNQKETENSVLSLPEDWKNIDVLINNAGLAAGFAPIHEGSIDDWDQMIDTNIKGLLYATRVIAPLMVKRKSGHIINIGSIAGKEAYENGNVYNGTKHAVEGITKGMRIDLVKHNVKVTSICPGAVDTEFSNVRFKWDYEKAKNVYKGFTPLYADDIAEAILFAVTRPAHVNINDMLIMPTDQASMTVINKKDN